MKYTCTGAEHREKRDPLQMGPHPAVACRTILQHEAGGYRTCSGIQDKMPFAVKFPRQHPSLAEHGARGDPEHGEAKTATFAVLCRAPGRYG